MKKSSKLLNEIIAYSFVTLIVTIVIVTLSWILFKILNAIFAFLNLNFHLELVYILLGLIIFTLINLLSSSNSMKYKYHSKTAQNEEDWRWIRDYVGDDY